MRFRDGISFSRLLFNDLETVTVPEHPDIAEAKAQLIRLGADGVLMSGSGPTVFGLFSEKKQAEEALSSLRLLSKGGSLQKGEPEKRQFLPAVLIV